MKHTGRPPFPSIRVPMASFEDLKRVFSGLLSAPSVMKRIKTCVSHSVVSDSTKATC